MTRARSVADITKSGAVSLASLADAAKVFDVEFLAGYAWDLSGEDIAVQTYGRYLITRDCTIEGELANLVTAATGAALIFDFELNGTTIYSSKPQFAASSTTLSAGTLSTTSASAGDVITAKVTQKGSSVAGQKLLFGLKLRLR